MSLNATAKTLVFNENGQVLILSRSEYKEHPDRSHAPDLPGGMVDNGEPEKTAAIREVKEETGIVLDETKVVLAFAKTIFFDDTQSSQSKLLYMIKLDFTPNVTLSSEHESFEWIEFETLLETHSFVSFYEEAINYINNKGLIKNL